MGQGMVPGRGPIDPTYNAWLQMMLPAYVAGQVFQKSGPAQTGMMNYRPPEMMGGMAERHFQMLLGQGYDPATAYRMTMQTMHIQSQPGYQGPPQAGMSPPPNQQNMKQAVGGRQTPNAPPSKDYKGEIGQQKPKQKEKAM